MDVNNEEITGENTPRHIERSKRNRDFLRKLYRTTRLKDRCLIE